MHLCTPLSNNLTSVVISAILKDNDYLFLTEFPI